MTMPFGLMLPLGLHMDGLSLFLLGTIAALVVIVLLQRRASGKLAQQLAALPQQAPTNIKPLAELEEQVREQTQPTPIVEPPENPNDSRIKDLEEHLAAARGKITELEADLKEFQSRTKVLQDALETSQARTKDLEAQRERAERETLRLQDEMAESRALVATKTLEIEAASLAAKTLQDELAEARERVRQHVGQLLQAQTKAQELEKQAALVQVQLESLRVELEEARKRAATDQGKLAAESHEQGEELRRLKAKADELAKELNDLRVADEARIRGLTNALRQVEEELTAVQMQKDAFVGEARVLRDELERRKKMAEAEGKPAVKAKPSKPVEPIVTYYCLVCGEGGTGSKPHRCLVEELEAQKRALNKRPS